MERAVEKAGILIEALPYIQRFRGTEVVVKYGGAAMDDATMRKSILSDLVFMSFVGIRPILIHGGGPAITEAMKKEGITPRFVEGHRVTDKQTIEVVSRTLGEINRQLVREINDMGAKAMGLSGFHNDILSVEKDETFGDLGYVGRVKSVNIMPIKELTEFGRIPVIYPLGIGDDEQKYNINGDEACAKIAIAVQARKLIMLTSVAGILRDMEVPESLISTVKLSEVDILKDQKIVSGGMIPKVNACVNAIKGGVKKAHIVNGRFKHSLLLEIFTDQGIGTEIIRDEPEAV